MNKLLTIQEMARNTGLTEHTLRYYERVGLIKAISRNSSGHRQYSSNDREWIEFLIRLRSTGMTIRDMLRFADLRNQGNKTVNERRKMLEEHIQSVRKTIMELKQSELVLLKKINYYQDIEESLNKTIKSRSRGKSYE